ncbi:MAG: hypothetical protein AAFO73_03990 [Pseudomonadota bacterium]
MTTSQTVTKALSKLAARITHSSLATAMVLTGGLTAATALGGGSTAAHADSCWNHNGSIMRLRSRGNQRWMYYERPRQVLRNAGVRRGTLLFNGTNNGGWYSGTARRFSRFCVGNPLTYYVEGPVSNSSTRITINGQRPVHNRCRATGRTNYDRLVFTYAYDC